MKTDRLTGEANAALLMMIITILMVMNITITLTCQ
jgi:hypothetical protein